MQKLYLFSPSHIMHLISHFTSFYTKPYLLLFWVLCLTITIIIHIIRFCFWRQLHLFFFGGGYIPYFLVFLHLCVDICILKKIPSSPKCSQELTLYRRKLSPVNLLRDSKTLKTLCWFQSPSLFLVTPLPCKVVWSLSVVWDGWDKIQSPR